jgi:hypothetical protein
VATQLGAPQEGLSSLSKHASKHQMKSGHTYTIAPFVPLLTLDAELGGQRYVLDMVMQ